MTAGSLTGELPHPLLPDIIIRQSTLYDHDVVTNIVPGRRHLRLSNATPNIGLGKLYLYGVTPGNPDGTQNIMQRIWLDDGNYFDEPAGKFIYHSSHNHIHVEDWSIYRLREILPGDGVGPILAQGAKTSFCILDLQIYDSSLPGYSPVAEFNSCSTTVQGLSVGWSDIYSKNLTGQNIDITGIPDGQYWLEAEVDPDDHMREVDELNNAARIKVTIGAPLAIAPDPYEPNQSRGELDLRPIGGVNSPSLGPCGPLRKIEGLTIHASNNDDWYRFYLPTTANSSHFVRIEFVHALGDLDMTLLNSAGSTVGSATGSSDSETISLNGRPAGYYDLRVYGYSGATNSDYTLTIDPPANGTPLIDVLNPPAGQILVLQGVETYTVTWTASDPEANPIWVNVYVNHEPVWNGQQIHLTTSTNTPGEYGLHVINTSELGFGPWYVYTEITDGGSVSGEWSDGSIYLWDPVVSAPPVTRITRLHAPSPNPFNPRTVLRLELDAAAAAVDWAVFDLRGARVATIERGSLGAGLHERIFEGKDDAGRKLASGVYLVRAKLGDWQQSVKVVLAQ
jgi:hypothetical protein